MQLVFECVCVRECGSAHVVLEESLRMYCMHVCFAKMYAYTDSPLRLSD